MKYVIIGAGAAGMTAAKTIRAHSPGACIVLISEDAKVHSRCMLYKYISGERDEAELNFVPEDFFETNNIKWISGTKVNNVDISTKTLKYGHDTINYDKLLIAAGAVSTDVSVTALNGAKNVYGLRDLPDARAIRNAAVGADSKRAVVIGAGFVGLAAAYALSKLGTNVTIVEMGAHLLPHNLDERAASTYQERFETAGCKFSFGRKVVDATLDGNGNAERLILDDGSDLLCDFVVSASGVRPAVAFLEGSKIASERGVEVDNHMMTNCQDVYAAGDITGLSGIWPNAMRQGEIAAKNMCGITEQYNDSFSAKNTVNFFGLITLALGASDPEADDTVESYDDKRGYRKIIMRKGRVVGVLMQGDIAHSGFWQYIIKNEIPIDNLKKSVHKVSFADFCGVDEQGKYYYAVD